VDEGHINIPSPQAPSFVALEAATGKLVWERHLPGDKIFHGTWSNPTFATIKGRPQVIFPGGDGWLYSLEPKTGKLLWKFNANPPGSKYVLGGRGTANEIIATAVVYEDRVYVGVGQDPEHGEGIGNCWCIDATLDGDVTEKGKVWHRGGNDFHRTISTVAIQDGIVYAADLSGFLYALDAKTGQPYWTHDLLAAVWGSPFVADGKVYIGDEDGDVAILKAGKVKQVIAEPNVGVSVYSTPVAKDGVLYVLGRNRLFALQEGALGKPSTPRKGGGE
jgi:outer membrane protein assembly factor BamB